MKKIFILSIVLVVLLSSCVGNEVSDVVSNVSTDVSVDNSVPETSEAESSDFETSEEVSDVFEESEESVPEDESDADESGVVVTKLKIVSSTEIKDILFSEIDTLISNHGDPTKEFSLDSNEKWFYFDSLGFSVGVMNDSNEIQHVLIHSLAALSELGITSDLLVCIDEKVSPDMLFSEADEAWGESDVQSIYDKESGKRTYFSEYSIDGLLFEISTSLSDGSEDGHIIEKILVTKD